MNTLRFEPALRLDLVQADADVAINGWNQPTIELTMDGDLDQCSVERTQDTLTVTSQAALAIYVPRAITVNVQQVFGDLLLRALDGEIVINAVHGALSVRGDAASVSIQEVEGDLGAKGLTGPLEANVVHGDVRLADLLGGHLDHIEGNVHARSIAQDLELGDVGGDMVLRSIAGALKLEVGHGAMQAYDLHGGLQAGRLAGDLSLKTHLHPGCSYSAYAEGQIRARFPPETSARFDLQSESLVSAQLPSLERQEPTHVVGQAGAGEATVILKADGDLWVHIQGQNEDAFDAWQTMDSISARIEAEIAEHLGTMSIDATTQREIDKAIRKAEQELARAQQNLERETQRAQERARRAQEQAAKAAKRAQERIARRSRSWGMPIDVSPGLFGPLPPRPPRPHPPTVSAEEQLAILKMLQESKITVEQAEQLLKALEE